MVEPDATTRQPVAEGSLAMTMIKAISITAAVLLIAVALSFTMPFRQQQCWEHECWDVTSFKSHPPSFCGIIGCEK
jgi:hypothetical protein